MDSNLKLKTRFSFVYIIIAFFALLLVQEYIIGPLVAGEEEVPYSRFRQDLAQGLIDDVTVEPERIVYSVTGADDDTEKTDARRKAVRIEDRDLVRDLVDAGVEFEAHTPSKSVLEQMFGWILPILPFVVIWWFLMKRLGKGGAGGMMSFGKSKATEISGEMSTVTFADVGVATDGKGKLYVADAANNRIVVLSIEDRFIGPQVNVVVGEHLLDGQVGVMAHDIDFIVGPGCQGGAR